MKSNDRAGRNSDKTFFSKRTKHTERKSYKRNKKEKWRENDQAPRNNGRIQIFLPRLI